MAMGWVVGMVVAANEAVEGILKMTMIKMI